MKSRDRHPAAIDTGTALFGVIGNPVHHSLGPVMHNHAFACTGFQGVYLAFNVTDIEAAVAGMRGLNIRGLSVTIPHKVPIMAHLDRIDDTARLIGAVNTVVNRDGMLYGCNSDMFGAIKALNEKTTIAGRDVVIIGAGGAARAIGFGVKQAGGRVRIVNRTVEKGEMLASALDVDFSPTEHMADVFCDILINTTPVGMFPKTDALPVPPAFIRPEMTVMDIVYNPIETRLIRTAKETGCQTIDGVAMFVFQGAMQFEMWTDLPAPIDEMQRVVRNALNKRNLGVTHATDHTP